MEEKRSLATQFFLSSLSHEIRTPLNGIIGYNQLLMQTKLKPIQKTYLNSMNKCCIQLMGLINDILDYSKLATNKMGINNECFAIKEVIDVVNNTIGCRLKEKRQRCRYVIDKNLPLYIVSDKNKIIQIIINLISNANKFTDIGGHISIHISPKEGNIIEFTVQDNGIGISEENQDRLFDAFYQIGESVTKTGSGLGLAICQKLVVLLGGDIHVQSELEKGSTFSFTITYESYNEFEKEVEKDIGSLKGKYVLVVDDNLDNRIIIGEILFGWKMKPVICATALEALRLSMRENYDFSIGLIDICMPGITGTELAKQIKEERPFLPLIALSSLDELIDTSNFEYTLNKPINKAQLLTYMLKSLRKENINSARLSDSDSDSDYSGMPNKDTKILIAEDNNLDVLVSMLEVMQFNDIDTAINGKEAIEKLDKSYEAKDQYEILLLDLRMPLVDGVQVMEHINKKKYTTKIVVLTASILDSDREKCKELGVEYFILKPVNIGQLKNVLVCMTEKSIV